MDKMKLLLVGNINDFCLETSYAYAANQIGSVVERFEPAKEVRKHVKFGKVGAKFQQFVPVEAWIKKMNRELILKCKGFNPDMVLFFANTNIQAGTLATIKIIFPKVKLVEVWPDTPMNLEQTLLTAAPLFDLCACYSSSAVEHYHALGFKQVQWVALAGDPNLHSMNLNNSDFDCDISFVGMWRPEREFVIETIIKTFPELDFHLYGVYWKRNCKNENIMKKWKGEALFGKDMAACFSKSKININIIDDTNFPAANMRFFEIPAAGGLQLSSACPEFEKELIDEQDILYFKSETELIDKINWIKKNEEKCKEIRISGQRQVFEKHNYTERLKTIIKYLN